MRARLTYANVISTLALFAVIAGGAAAALPGKKTVQANDLRKNSVKAVAIAAKAVRSAEIKNGAVGSAEVADGSIGYGELGSNSVIARIRSAGSVATGAATQNNRVSMPSTGGSWTQAPGEMDIFFGEVTYTVPGACTNGGPVIFLKVDNQAIDDGFAEGYFVNAPGTYTESFLIARPWLPEAASATSHTASVEVYDDCENGGESVTVDSVKANVVAVR